MPKKGKAIYIDRKHQRIYLYVDGRQIDTFLCSTSRTLPRRGTYYRKFRRPASMSYNGAVTFKWQTVFTKGPHGGNIGFHTIPVNRAGREIAPVGKPVSHGCVRCPKAEGEVPLLLDHQEDADHRPPVASALGLGGRHDLDELDLEGEVLARERVVEVQRHVLLADFGDRRGDALALGS